MCSEDGRERERATYPGVFTKYRWDNIMIDLQAALEEMRPAIQQVVQGCHEFTAIQGDCCFSNILFDVSSGICRFIDPRGSFGHLLGYWGDPLYDVSKIYHSVEGLYDSIVNDLFTVYPDGANYELNLYSPEQLSEIKGHFESVFLSEQSGSLGFSKHHILVINFLLFSSMIALHVNKPERQLAMGLRALHFYRRWRNEHDTKFSR